MVTRHTTKGVTLQAYADLATDPGFTNRDRYRAIVVNLARRLHDLEPQACATVLKKRPELSHTPWDALLAAVAEHTALRDGHPVEPWMDEAARFVDIPWFPTLTPHHMRVEALLLSPGAFVRHGTPVHPSDLDPRGGDPLWTRAVLHSIARSKPGLTPPSVPHDEQAWLEQLAANAFPRYTRTQTPQGLTLEVQDSPDAPPQTIKRGLTLQGLARLECAHRDWPDEATGTIKGFAAATLATSVRASARHHRHPGNDPAQTRKSV